jgi:hypothetical protein
MHRCPECGDGLAEYAPFDPELLGAGLFRTHWSVFACRLCGYVERALDPAYRATAFALGRALERGRPGIGPVPAPS